MRLSRLFTKTRKEAPAGEVSVNAQLLQRAGFVYKEMAGVYTFLPLGLRVLTKIENIVRKHIDRVGSEMLMTALAPTQNREATGRLETIDVLMKTQGANDISREKSTNEYVLNCTHEDMVTPIVKSYVNSYKDLPVTVYQIQNKFRNEARAKSGLMRGREFRMKDLYSFHPSQESFADYYEQVKQVYVDIFDELGIGESTYVTLASGGDFTKRYSHEFQTLCAAGEDIVYIDKNSKHAINQEVRNDETRALFPDAEREETKASEVGNIFPLESKFSNALDFQYIDKDNSKKDIIMGSYGIGPSRVMGVIVEKMHDEKGILRPEHIAPFQYCIIAIGEKWSVRAAEVYEDLKKHWVDVCLDDRDAGPWFKFKDADLIGYPRQIVIGDMTLKKWDMCELVERKTGMKKNIANGALLHHIWE